jgi:hypothetical protein
MCQFHYLMKADAAQPQGCFVARFDAVAEAIGEQAEESGERLS